MESNEYLNFAKEMCSEAGKIMKKYFYQDSGISYKGDRTIVTLADNVNEIGNLALAGHNNYDGTMFGKNDELVVGDKIYLTDLQKNTVEYEINSIFVTDPNDVSILETNEEEIREVTLITCENGNKARLIIKAEEVKK